LSTVCETLEHLFEASQPSMVTTCSPSSHSRKLMLGVDQVLPLELTEPVSEPSIAIVKLTVSPSGSLYCPCIDHCEPSHSVEVMLSEGGELSLEMLRSYTCSME